jgi:ferric-dicitrate binding protein FerR (iron transport regulator)
MTDIALLIHKYLKEELDGRERQELEEWQARSESNRHIFEKLTNDEYLLTAIGDAYKIDSDALAQQKINALIDAGQYKTATPIKSIWSRLSVAAAILILLSVTTIYIFRKNQKRGTDIVNTSTTKPAITPGTFKATLQLADGKSIVLDSAAIGQLAQQGSTQVLNKKGELVYSSPTKGGQAGAVLWNTLSTAKGQTYHLTLSDNSEAWLNSESSIRFPVTFTGDKRQVEITGEVFLEVAHDADKPFTVMAQGVYVNVLGTKFNVNAYEDEEAIKTTLVEGSVKISKGIQQKQLKPGQQAQVVANEIRVLENVDVDKVTAWKQGYFRFKEDKLSEAMKNIARWYNIEVVFEGNAANVEISGNIHRSSNISDLLKLLGAIDVNANIEGRKLILKAQ